MTEHTLCMFIACLAREGLVHQTIRSAIRHFHILAGQGKPFVGDPYPMLQYVLRRSPTRTTRLPITPTIRRTLKQQWQTMAARDQDYIMLWAVCCMGFFGFMRAGEFAIQRQCDLCHWDMAVDSHPLRYSTNSETEQPFAREWQCTWAGRTQDLCPVAAIMSPVGGTFFMFKDGTT